MSKFNVWPWLRPFLILLLVVSVPPLLYWFGYVQTTVSAAKQQAYEATSAIAAEFKDRLAAHDQIAVTAEKYVLADPHFDHLKNYLAAVIRSKKFTVVPQRDFHLEFSEIDGGLHLQVGRNESGKTLRAHVAVDTLIPWSTVRAEFDGLLVLTQTGRLLAQDRRLPAQPMGAVVPITLGGALVKFPVIGGEVAKESDSKPVTEAAKKQLRSPFDFADDTSVQIAGTDYLAFVQPVSVTVTYTGTDPNARLPEHRTLLICGLVQKDHLRRKAVQLSPQTLVGVGSLVLLGALAIPFLKLRFIGARERMRPRDVWLLAGSILCATALMTLTILNGHALAKLRDRFDAGLNLFAMDIGDHLQRESAGAVAQLRASTPDLLASMRVDKEGADSHSAFPCPLTKTQSRLATCPSWTGGILATRDFASYAHFEALFIVDSNGNQIGKWMPRTIPTPSVNVKEQRYFADTLANHSSSDFMFSPTLALTSGLPLGIYSLPLRLESSWMDASVAPLNRNGIAVFATPMHSVNSPLVAQPFQFVLVDRDGGVIFQSAQVSYRGERFFESVRDGAALARSACVYGSNDSPEGKSLCKSAQGAEPRSSAQPYSYRGKVYRMRAMEIPELQATLVAFYDDTVIAGLAARTFLTAAAFSLATIVALLMTTVIAAAIFGERALDWAWPSSSRTGYYIVGIAICLLSAAALLLARCTVPARILSYMIVLLPAAILFSLGIPATAGALRRISVLLRRRRLFPRWVRRWNTAATPTTLNRMSCAYKCFAVIALLSFVAWPATLAFNDAFNLHSTVYIEVAKRQWRADEVKRQRQLDREWIDIGAPQAAPDCFRQKDWRCSGSDRISATRENYVHGRQLERSLSHYDRCADLVSIGGNCRVTRSVNLPSAAPFSFTAAAATWIAYAGRYDTDEKLVLAEIAQAQRATVPTTWLQGGQSTAWNSVGPLGLILTLFVLVGSIAKNVLGIELTDLCTLDESKQFLPVNGTRWLLLRPHHASLQAKLLQAYPDPGYVDHRDLEHDDLARPVVAPAGGKLLRLDHIEYYLRSKASRDKLLLSLRESCGGCQVLISDIDPLHYIEQRLHEKNDYLRSLPAADKQKQLAVQAECRELHQELSEWAIVLRNFRKVRRRPPNSIASLRKSRCSNLKTRLAAECAALELLRDIRERLRVRGDEFDTYSWSDLVSFVQDAAEPCYRSIWELCSREERLLLIQLAHSGLINPKRMETARRLARRGLIIVDPRFRLMNDSFTRFVCNVEPMERIAEWEHTAAEGSWSRLGTPLYAFAAMVIAILLYTEQGMFSSMLALGTGTAGTIASLRNLYASVAKVSPLVKLA